MHTCRQSVSLAFVLFLYPEKHIQCLLIYYNAAFSIMNGLFSNAKFLTFVFD